MKNHNFIQNLFKIKCRLKKWWKRMYLAKLQRILLYQTVEEMAIRQSSAWVTFNWKAKIMGLKAISKTVQPEMKKVMIWGVKLNLSKCITQNPSQSTKRWVEKIKKLQSKFWRKRSGNLWIIHLKNATIISKCSCIWIKRMIRGLDVPSLTQFMKIKVRMKRCCLKGQICKAVGTLRI